MGIAYSTGLRVLGPVYARAGCAYLAGQERTSALALAERLLAAGSDVTLGYWPRQAESAAHVSAEVKATLEALGELGADGDRAALSLKAARLGFDADVVRQLAKLALERHTRLVFDAHSPAEADRTLELARVARGEGASTGVVLPARWGRSAEDAVMASEYGLSVRVVKGQWRDDVPGGRLSGEGALRWSFLILLDRLAGLGVQVAVATHDVVLLEQAMARLAPSGTLPEVELLLGLPVRRALDTAQRAGASTRFYVSFGYPGLPYPFRAVLRRPRLAWLLAQGVVLGGRNQAIQQHAALG
jgi:proline dehydrogenase